MNIQSVFRKNIIKTAAICSMDNNNSNNSNKNQQHSNKDNAGKTFEVHVEASNDKKVIDEINMLSSDRLSISSSLYISLMNNGYHADMRPECVQEEYTKINTPAKTNTLELTI